MDKDSAFARFRQSFDYLKDSGVLHKQSDLCNALGIGRSHVSEFYNGKEKYFTEGNVRKYAAAFSEYLNPDWLLYGTGQMSAPDKAMRPHFEAKACAGFMYGVADGEVGTMHPHIYGMRDYDFTIEAEGNSMLPRIESGDLLVCRKSEDRANPPIGKICVVDGKDGAVVKVIVSADDVAGLITLHSPNPEYEDYNVPFSDILGIAEVVGLVRSF